MSAAHDQSHWTRPDLVDLRGDRRSPTSAEKKCRRERGWLASSDSGSSGALRMENALAAKRFYAGNAENLVSTESDTLSRSGQFVGTRGRVGRRHINSIRLGSGPCMSYLRKIPLLCS